MDSPWLRRLFLFVAFALVGWLLGRLWLRRPPVTENVTAPPPTVAKAPTPAPKPKVAKPKKKKVVAVAKPADDEYSNIIPFRVENGQAIAYGDVLLGTPDDPDIKEGFYEAQPPQLWDRPEIPYAINPDLPRPERVKQAIDYMEAKTSVRFVPYTDQPDVVVFEPTNEHCYSLLGRVGGAQPIRLAGECTWHEILHEMMHALGFVHEHSRRDRDQYIKVEWDNIEDKYKPQFEVVPLSFMAAVGESPFDYRSVMLYRPDMFQRNPGLPTLRSLGSTPIAPVAEGLSDGDIERLRRLYR